MCVGQLARGNTLCCRTMFTGRRAVVQVGVGVDRSGRSSWDQAEGSPSALQPQTRLIGGSNTFPLRE